MKNYLLLPKSLDRMSAALLFVSLQLLVPVALHAQVIPGDPGNYITTWQTDNSGDSADDQIILPIDPAETYHYHVYWEEVGNAANHGSQMDVMGPLTITFPNPGTYRMEITGGFPRNYFGIGTGDFAKLVAINQWGNIKWRTMKRAFYIAGNMEYKATDVPDLSAVTDLSQMFNAAKLFNGDLSGWDVSNVTNMAGMFDGADSFNGDISSWDVSNVTDMSLMFLSADVFNQDIGGWDVSKVRSMEYMFSSANAFNQDLSTWDVSNVIEMRMMFYSALDFNQSLGAWKMSTGARMAVMLDWSGISRANYDATLMGWAAQGNIPSGITLGARALFYCSGADARQQLIDEKGWSFDGDSENCGVLTTPDENNILYVDSQVNTADPGYTAAGDSWANAIPKLADALKWAEQNGRKWASPARQLQIWVTTGIYKPMYSPVYEDLGTDAGRDNSFLMVRNVQLYGGFDPANGIFDLEDERIIGSGGTVLSGDIGTTNNNSDNVYHVLISAEQVGSARLDGFTVTGGNANNPDPGGISVSGQNIGRNQGGGMHIGNSSPTIIHCNFTGNAAVGYGGGIYSSWGSPLFITQSSFTDNLAASGGGGMFSEMATISLENVAFLGNRADEGGGAIHNQLSMGTYTNVTLAANATAGGTGFYMSGISTWNNSIIWDQVVVKNASFGGQGEFESIFELNNSVLKENVNHTGNDNIIGTGLDAAAIFSDPVNGDYRLQACGPAINTGNNALLPAGVTQDADGNPRTVHEVVDMGAFEYQDALLEGGAALGMHNDERIKTINGITDFLGNDEACRLIARIAPTGTNPVSGSVTAQVAIDPEVAFHNGAPYVQRHYLINAQTGESAKITLYFTQAEFDNFNDEMLTGQLPGNASGDKSSLRVYQYHGTSGHTPGEYQGSTLTIIDPQDEDIKWNDVRKRWEVSFGVNGFSGFFIGSAASPLPVKLVSFSGSVAPENSVTLNWKVVEQQNIKDYKIQYSSNGVVFQDAGTIAATQTEKAGYTFRHTPPQGKAIVYYRLLISEADGAQSYSRIISIKISDRSIPFAYPVPTDDGFWVKGQGVAGCTASLINMHGVLLKTLAFSSDQQYVDIRSLQPGVYFVLFRDGSALKVVKK